MKKLIFLAVLLSPLSLFAQTEGDYPHQLTDVAVRLDGGSVVAAGGAVTGGTCTNQVMTALDTAGLPTCANISSAMIPAATIAFSDIADGSALSVLGTAANSAGVMASIQCAAAGAGVIRESGSTLGCGTVATAGIANSAITLAKIANAAANAVVVGSGASGSGAAYTEIPASSAGNGVMVTTTPGGTATLGFAPKAQWQIYEEFDFPASGITDAGARLNWTIGTANTPGNFSTTAATDVANHPGVVQLLGNAGSTASVIIRTGTSAYGVVAGLVMECEIKILSAATGNGKYGCGLNDSTTDFSSGTDSLTLYYDSSVGANWVPRTRANTGGGSHASNLAVTFDAWHRLTIWVEAVTGSRNGTVHFYVDGTELNVSPLGAASGEIPQTTDLLGLNVGFVQSTGGAGVPLMQIDYIMAYGPVTR